MIRMFMRLATGWMLIVSLLAVGRPGWVVCLGDDGHLTMKPDHQGHCGHAHDATDAQDEDAALWEASTAACETSGCVDLSLGGDSLLHILKPATQDRLKIPNGLPFYRIGGAPLAQAGGQRSQRLATGATHLPAQSLLEQRTIVLLL